MMVISNKISKKGPRTPVARAMISPKTQKPLFSQISWADGSPDQETQLNPPFNHLNSRETITIECSCIFMRWFVLGLRLEDSGTVRGGVRHTFE